MLNIIDNFVKPRIQDDIERLFLDNNFPYFYNPVTVVHASSGVVEYSDGPLLVDENTLDSPQFTHHFVSGDKIVSRYWDMISPISNKLIDTIDVDSYVTRCKINLNTMDIRYEDKYHTPHIDNAFENQITAIYYVNDSDGDTFFFDDDGKITKRVTPKKGRLVWWKGKIFHAKASPVKTPQRMVLNYNILPY
jgi:hypothetical protein